MIRTLPKARLTMSTILRGQLPFLAQKGADAEKAYQEEKERDDVSFTAHLTDAMKVDEVGAAVTFHFGAVAWSLLLALVHFLNAISGGRWQGVGVMDPTAVQNGAWWRLFTATLLHFDLAHLMANLAIGLPVMGLAMSRYGPACAWLAAYLAGAAGNVAGLLLHTQPRPALGASGMVMGALGLLTVQTFSLRLKDSRSWKYIIAGVLGGLLLFALLGLNPAGDVVAHFGGFVCGLMLGAAMALVPQKRLLGSSANVVCGILLAGLMALTWTLALRHGASPP